MGFSIKPGSGKKRKGFVEDHQAEAYIASLKASPAASKKAVQHAQDMWQDIKYLRERTSTGLARFPLFDILSNDCTDHRGILTRLEKRFQEEMAVWDGNQKSLLKTD